jgi:hypothetical protein
MNLYVFLTGLPLLLELHIMNIWLALSYTRHTEKNCWWSIFLLRAVHLGKKTDKQMFHLHAWSKGGVVLNTLAELTSLREAVNSFSVAGLNWILRTLPFLLKDQWFNIGRPDLGLAFGMYSYDYCSFFFFFGSVFPNSSCSDRWSQASSSHNQSYVYWDLGLMWPWPDKEGCADETSLHVEGSWAVLLEIRHHNLVHLSRSRDPPSTQFLVKLFWAAWPIKPDCQKQGWSQDCLDLTSVTDHTNLNKILITSW